MNESRGSTLEVVISRMRMRGLAIRFILVSATVPNIADVAELIGSQSSEQGVITSPATVFEVNETIESQNLTLTFLHF